MEPIPVRHTVVAAPVPPRPLPEGEPLPAEDYRRLAGVIEAVDRAPDLLAFREALLRALSTWFGYTAIAVLHGPTVAQAMTDGQGIHSGYSREFLDEYATRWIRSDPFMSSEAWRIMAERGVVTIADVRDPDDPAQRDFVENFFRPHGIADKMGMVIDAGAAGAMYVGATVANVAAVPPRDLAVLRVLRRHLAPYVTAQLERDRADQADEAGWRLTPREREVARLAAQGLTNQQIADRLFVGLDTVKKHLTRVLAETRSTSRTQLAIRWPRDPHRTRP